MNEYFANVAVGVCLLYFQPVSLQAVDLPVIFPSFSLYLLP